MLDRIIRFCFSFAILFVAWAAPVGTAGFASGAEAEKPAGSDETTAEESESAGDPAADEDEKVSLDPKQLSAIKFRSIGPALMSGRISDIALDSHNPNVWYVAAGSGGVWKTENAGTTWKPIFDNYASYSIGCVTIDPNNRRNIWVGTGENVAGRHVGIGDGIYFSSDAGKSFKNLGLSESEHISKIVVHPEDSDTVYAACQGPLWTPGGERGLYKSTDGGKTWKAILTKGEYTGVTDVVLHPDDPEIVFAATYEKHRTVAAFMAGGPESGIHRSTDGGETWTELTKGIPAGDKGKISLAISPQKTGVVYAAIELPQRKGGFFRSENGGNSFTKMSDYVGGGTGPHYYQEIWCDPHRFDSIYHANVMLGYSADGGKTFESRARSGKHVDNHAVAFHPTDPNTVVVGCDGGLYVSHDQCKTYRFAANLPLTQFYKLDVDNDYPFYNVVGGTQDNSTQYGPSATNRAQGITNRDWRVIIGGDGHDCAIDPEDPNVIYGESQQGYIRRYDRRTGESIDIRPQPAADETELRFNWDSPIEISFHNHKRLYFGSKKLHRSDDQGNSWQAISPDLSRNENRLKMRILGQYWGMDDSWDHYAMSEYNNVTSIGESPLDENLIYVGTDDGLIQITEDGGQNWRKVDLIYGLPEFAFVNDIKACRHDVDTVFVCCDNHKYGDYKPYVLKSTDRGQTWEIITTGIPEKHLCWRIIQDHQQESLMFLATEYGVFATIDGGEEWFKFSHGLPTISVRDIEIQRRENDLVIATFGRGMYVLDDYSPLRNLDPAMFKQQDFHMFDVRDAKQFPRADYLGGRRGFQGSSFFTASNPSYGATWTYFLREDFKSAKAKRKKAEKAAREAKKEIPYPSVEELAAERLETTPKLVFTVRDDSNEVVKRLQADVAKGVKKLTWDLRNQGGRQVMPGEYTVSVDRVHGGETESLMEAKAFQVVSGIASMVNAGDRRKALSYFEEAREFRNKYRRASQAFSRSNDLLDKVEQAIKAADEPFYELRGELVELRKEYADLERQLRGTPDSDRIGEGSTMTISQRLRIGTAYDAGLSSPTQTQQDSLKIAIEMYDQLRPALAQFADVTVKEFVEKAREAGVEGIEGESIPE